MKLDLSHTCTLIFYMNGACSIGNTNAAIVTKCINKQYMHVFCLVFKFLFIIYFTLSTNLVTLNSIPASEILKQKTKAIPRLPNASDI